MPLKTRRFPRWRNFCSSDPRRNGATARSSSKFADLQGKLPNSNARSWEVAGGAALDFPCFQYRQADARYLGFEAEAPTDGFTRVDASVSFTAHLSL